MDKQAKKWEHNDRSWQKKTSTKSSEKLIRKVKKVIQPAKKVNKIFQFTKEVSASAWEGFLHSGCAMVT